MILKYLEVYKNMLFGIIPNMLLELRADIDRTIKNTAGVNVVDNPEDGAHIGPFSDRIQK